MARHRFKLLFLSVIGGVAGYFVGALTSFWLYPQLQSDLSLFLRDLFSFGPLASAGFVWLFYAPAVVLLLLYKQLMSIKRRDISYRLISGVSFLLVFVSQIHPFSAIAGGVFEYLLNMMLAGTILAGIIAAMRNQRNK